MSNCRSSTSKTKKRYSVSYVYGRYLLDKRWYVRDSADDSDIASDIDTRADAVRIRTALNRQDAVKAGCRCDTWVLKYGRGHMGPGGTRVRRWHSNGGIGYSLPESFTFCPQCGCELKETV